MIGQYVGSRSRCFRIERHTAGAAGAAGDFTLILYRFVLGPCSPSPSVKVRFCWRLDFRDWAIHVSIVGICWNFKQTIECSCRAHITNKFMAFPDCSHNVLGDRPCLGQLNTQSFAVGWSLPAAKLSCPNEEKMGKPQRQSSLERRTQMFECGWSVMMIRLSIPKKKNLARKHQGHWLLFQFHESTQCTPVWPLVQDSATNLRTKVLQLTQNSTQQRTNNWRGGSSSRCFVFSHLSLFANHMMMNKRLFCSQEALGTHNLWCCHPPVAVEIQ